MTLTYKVTAHSFATGKLWEGHVTAKPYGQFWLAKHSKFAKSSQASVTPKAAIKQMMHANGYMYATAELDER